MPTSGGHSHRSAARVTARSAPCGRPNRSRPRHRRAVGESPSRPADEGHVEGVGKAMLRMAVQHDAVAEALLQPLPEAVAQAADAGHRCEVLREHTGGAESPRRATRSRCRHAGPAHDRHRGSAARDRHRDGHRARRRPWARRACARRSSAGRRRGRPRWSGSCRPTGPRRCGKRSRARGAISPISSIGWIVPTSLLACMTLIRMVRGVMARRTASGST